MRRRGRDGGEGHWFEERREGVKKEKKKSQEVASSKERKKKGSQSAFVFVFIRSSKA